MPSVREILFKGLMSGLAWTLFPLLVFSQSFGRYSAWWMLICGCLTGVLVTLLLRSTGRGLGPRSRLLLCIPTVFLGEALWALLLTLPIVSEGKWPERWYELTLGFTTPTPWPLHSPVRPAGIPECLVGAGLRCHGQPLRTRDS